MTRSFSGLRSATAAIVLLFGWLAVTAWLRPFTAPDEGRYAGVAMAMLRSGDWLVPRLDGLPFFHKPPLFYWIGATAMQVFGAHEGAARLPSLLGATLAGASLYLFVRRWAGVAAAWLSLLVLATMPFFFVGAQFANLDMLVAGCIAATVLAAAHAALLRESGLPWRRAALAIYLTAALGLLAKGLIGVVLPGAVLVVWSLLVRRPRRMAVLFWLPGWLLLLAVSMPWFVLMQLRFPMFFDYFVVTQHFRRFAEAGFNNVHPFWFYLPVLAGLVLPWSFWLAPALRRAGAWRSTMTDIDWLMVAWLAVIVLFFSLPRSKLVGYVLPALPPLAWFVASALQARPRAWRWTAGIAAAACIACVLAARVWAVSPGARLVLPAGVQVAPQDRVLMLGDYLYELPFYWKLSQDVAVAGDWSPAVARARDNWRKELFDAAQFDPAAQRRVLVALSDVPAMLCAPGTTWLIGNPADPEVAALVTGLWPVAAAPRLAAWRISVPAGGGCGGSVPPRKVLP